MKITGQFGKIVGELRSSEKNSLRFVNDVSKKKGVVFSSAKKQSSLLRPATIKRIPKLCENPVVSASKSAGKEQPSEYGSDKDSNNNSVAPVKLQSPPEACPSVNGVVKCLYSGFDVKVGMFLKMIDGDFFQSFLAFDKCFLMSDCYILAMTFSYMQQVTCPAQYCPRLFFQCLYIACAMEEDDPDLQHETLRWMFNTKSKYFPHRKQVFIRGVRQVLKILRYRTIVDKSLCDRIMQTAPHHQAWKRKRTPRHGRAIRDHTKNFHLRVSKSAMQPPTLHCFVCDMVQLEKEKEQLVTPENGGNEQRDSGFGHSSVMRDSPNINPSTPYPYQGTERRERVETMWNSFGIAYE